MRNARRLLNYVLVTPARNERDLIEGAIRSVVAQTHLPSRWVIVSDGSTDGTDEIVERFAEEHIRGSNCCECLSIATAVSPPRQSASTPATNACSRRTLTSSAISMPTSRSARTIMSSCWRVCGESHDLASQARLSSRMRASRRITPTRTSLRIFEHVSGACQMFRRRCFEEVGGYTPIKGGGIDWVAVTTARMKGWQTRTFLEKTCFHHRKMGTAGPEPIDGAVSTWSGGLLRRRTSRCGRSCAECFK